MTTLTMESDFESLIAGRYRVDREIAGGGIAIVYEALDVLSGSSVAIKMLRQGANKIAASRLMSEALAVARLESRHVVRVLDVGKIDGWPFVVMELLDGEDLSMYLRRVGPLPLEEAATYVIEACHALSDAHAAGMVHRDIKPSNLFRHADRDGSITIKLIDFGIAKSFAMEQTLTTDGQLLGSPPYMSPEQIQDAKSVDPRADLWSLGVVMYRLLTNELPFAAVSVDAVVARILDTPRLPRLSTRGFPKALDDILARCVTLEPSDRFEDVMALAHALEIFTKPRGLDRRARLIAAAPVTVALVATIAALTVALARPPRTPALDTAEAPQSFAPASGNLQASSEASPTETIEIVEAAPSATTHGPTQRHAIPPVTRRVPPRKELQPNPYAGEPR